MKKYFFTFLIVSLSIINFKVDASDRFTDSLLKVNYSYFVHTIKISPYAEVIQDFNIGYEYHPLQRFAVELYYEKDYPWKDGSNGTITFQPNDGRTNWGFYQFKSDKYRVGLKYFCNSKLTEYFQFNLGYYYKTLRTASMALGTGDDRDYWGLLFNQQKKEYVLQAVYGFSPSKKTAYINIYFGFGLRMDKTSTQYLDAWNSYSTAISKEEAFKHTKILYDSGKHFIPSIVLGLQTGLQFYRK